jgi:steroid delta-isomerase
MSAEALARLARYWETLTPASVEAIGEVYSEDAYFRDPFNEVRGLPALRRVFGHMFETLESPTFAIRDTLLQGDGAVLIWDFDFRVRSWRPRVQRRIHGLSHVRFAPDGRVAYHRDYWDAAGELYAHLPLLGRLIKMIGVRLGSS